MLKLKAETREQRDHGPDTIEISRNATPRDLLSVDEMAVDEKMANIFL